MGPTPLDRSIVPIHAKRLELKTTEPEGFVKARYTRDITIK